MRFFVLIAITFIFSFFAKAQEEKLEVINEVEEKNYYQYDNDFLPASFHKARRDSLRKLMPDSSAAVFFANPERNRSNDVYFEYHQDPNFYYLTGLREPNAMIVIYKEKQYFDGLETNEILFMQERNASSELWNGRRLGVDKALESLEIETILKNESLIDFNLDFKEVQKVYYQKPYALESQDTSRTDNLNGLYHHFLKKNTVETRSADKVLGTLMAKLRQVKTKEEIELLRKAISITCEAQNELMKNINSEMTEYQTEAIIEYVFKKKRFRISWFPLYTRKW